MTNSSGANDRSPSSPRRAPNSSPRGRGRGGPSPPVMGVLGHSAFTPYTRPPPPPPSHWVSPGSTRPSGSGTGALAVVPVGGASGSAAPGVQLGGNLMARKRVREGGAAGGNPPVDGAPNEVNCSLCGKVFLTPKALFGHMRSHRGRGWKGARPPPTFNAEEEFADIRGGQPEVGAAPLEDQEAQNYKLPDLNNPPPPDSPI